jgi:hypothetical protein
MAILAALFAAVLTADRVAVIRAQDRSGSCRQTFAAAADPAARCLPRNAGPRQCSRRCPAPIAWGGSPGPGTPAARGVRRPRGEDRSIAAGRQALTLVPGAAARWFSCGQGRVGCRRPAGVTSGSAAAQAWASGKSTSVTSARPAAPIRFQGRAAA